MRANYLGFAVFTMFCQSGSVFAEQRVQIAFGSEYTCKEGDARLIVYSCKPTYTFEACDVQFLNRAAPGGLGARDNSFRRERLEATLASWQCRIEGQAVNMSPRREGLPGEAFFNGHWFNVTIIEERGGQVHVRDEAGAENWMDSSRVRGRVE